MGITTCSKFIIEQGTKFCETSYESAAVLILGLSNRYFCRSQPLKKGKKMSAEGQVKYSVLTCPH
jgi:hypothetical protein